jgi:outer membrane lipoprotein carrier protein
MKNLLLYTLLLSIPFVGFAQNNQYVKAADSDPAARKVLEKVKKKYDAYKTLEADFTLTLEFPEQPVEEQKGKLIQQGEKYRLTLASQSIISDGASVWLYLKDNQEVQINSVEEDGEDILSPKDLLRVYEQEDYVYALTNEFVEDGKAVQQIEFKPVSDDSEYSKLRLTVDRNNQDILRIKAFAKDGSRFTLALNKMTPNKSFPAATFEWNKSECPDCYVEDLRID